MVEMKKKTRNDHGASLPTKTHSHDNGKKLVGALEFKFHMMSLLPLILNL